MVSSLSHLTAWEDSVLRKSAKDLKGILKHLMFSNTLTFSILFNEHTLSTSCVSSTVVGIQHTAGMREIPTSRVSNLTERYTNEQKSKQVERDVIK